MTTLDERPVAQHTGTMHCLDGSGDTRVIWSAQNPDEVQAAKEMFDSLRAKGHLAYTVDEDGERGEVIREFDKHAERIILSPQLVGG